MTQKWKKKALRKCYWTKTPQRLRQGLKTVAPAVEPAFFRACGFLSFVSFPFFLKLTSYV
jgi:hypothetical protein